MEKTKLINLIIENDVDDLDSENEGNDYRKFIEENPYRICGQSNETDYKKLLIDNPHKKCGEIILFENIIHSLSSVLIFECTLCYTYFENLSEFVNHLNEDHLKKYINSRKNNDNNITENTENNKNEINVIEAEDSENEIDVVEHENCENEINLLEIEDHENEVNMVEAEDCENEINLIEADDCEIEAYAVEAEDYEIEVNTVEAEDFQENENILKEYLYDNEGNDVESNDNEIEIPEICTYEEETKKQLVVNTKLQCDICKRNFNHFKNFKVHEEICRVIDSYEKKVLEINKLNDSNNIFKHKDPFICRYCNRKFQKRFRRVQHECSHNGLKLYYCEKCKKGFVDKRHIHTHKCITSKSEDINIQPHCPECNRVFKTEKNFKSHEENCRIIKLYESKVIDFNEKNQNTELNNKKNPLICRYCNRKCRTRIKCIYHECSHNGIRLYKCEYCGQEILNRYYYKLHLNIHKGVKLIKCHICNKTFTINAHLQIHLKRHFNERKFKCNYCDRRFVEPFEKKMHEKTHTSKKKRFLCNICGKSYANKNSLSTHCNEIHLSKSNSNSNNTNKNGYNLLPCSECNKSFKTQFRLSNHQRRMHTKFEDKFKCKQCEELYDTKYELQKHKKLAHCNNCSEDKKYHCSECNAIYGNKKTLWLHKQSHLKASSDKKYTCLCGKDFNHYYTYYNHRTACRRRQYKVLNKNES